jgi:alpha-D-xyloside xylohydrolase
MEVEVRLAPFGITLRDAFGRRACRVGGPDRNYFGLGDSLGTGIHDAPDGAQVATETFSLPPGHCVYGFGEGFIGLDKRGQTIDLHVSDAMGVNTGRMYKAVPFFVTTAGYGVFAHTSARVACWSGSRSANEVQLAAADDVLDYFVFLGTVGDVLADYTALTGRAPVPPPWSFGWWQSRCSYGSAEQVRDAVQSLRQGGFPVDVVHLDTFWFREDWRCDLEFAPDRFPDPTSFMRSLRDQGVHVSLWHLPYLVTGTRLHDRLAAVDGFVKDQTGEPYDVGIHFVQGYEGPVHCIDWTNPSTVEVMREEYGRLLEAGASVLKVDFGESAPQDGLYHDGTPGSRMHNLYPLLYQQAVHEATADVTGEHVTWSRSGWAGSQRYPVHWGGDCPADWEMLGPQLVGGLSLGLSGYTFWSCDIGGTNEIDDDELLVRWLQLGLMLSHTRIHGMGVREPSRWREPSSRIARDWIALRYRLLPYLLAAANDSAARGLPFARPLVLEFPDDPTVWRVDDQFCCGEALLVAPILAPGGRRRLYLPAGMWTDWWTRERVLGPRWLEVGHPLRTSPLYVREGALVPMGPPMLHVGERPTDPLTVVLSPFEDEGDTTKDVPVDRAMVKLRYRALRGQHGLEVEGIRGRLELDVLAPVRVSVET